MIRTAIFCSYLFCCSLSEYSISVDPKMLQEKMEYDRIEWSSNVKLTWKDFLGKPDTSSRYKAVTFTKIRVSDEEFDDKIILNFPATFNRSLSWTKNTKSMSLLIHEQIHFDIAELVARKIRKDCSQHVSRDLSLSYEFIQNTYDYYRTYCLDSINDTYDSETNHGMIKSKQKEWEKKISKELTSLKAYSSTQVEIKRVLKKN